MQSLILQRRTGVISPLEFSRTLADKNYQSQLFQTAKYNVFPMNAHHNALVNALSMDSDENRFLLSGCGDSSIKIWDTNEQEQIREENEIDLSKMNHPAKYDLFDYDNPVSVFKNMATVPRKTEHQFGVSAIQWWPYDTGMFVSSSFDHTIKVWDTNELCSVHTFNLNNRVYSVDLNGPKSLVAAASDQPFIRILDVRSTSSAHTLKGHKGKTLSVKWHPLNEHLLASGGYDGQAKIWDIRRSENLLCLLDMHHTNKQANTTFGLKKTTSTSISAPASAKAHLGPVNGLSWDELGTTLYTAGNDDKIRVWDMVGSSYPPVNKLINFGPLTRNKYTQTIPILLNPMGETNLQYLLFPSESGEILVHRTIDGKLVNRLGRKGSKNIGRTCSMCNGGPNTGSYICGTVDGELICWQVFSDYIDLSEIFEERKEEEEDVERLLLKKHTLALKAKNLMKSLEV